MATTYDKASLVMIPSGVKESKLYSIKPTDGSGDFTFSRGADTATRVNASGLIEKETSNQLLQSNSFDNASWTKTRTTLTGGQSGYDGTNDAFAFIDDSNNSTHLLYQPLSSLGASVATMSVYAKKGDVDFLAFRFEGAAVDYAYFNLASGTLGTIDSDYIEARITSVGGGWYRCEATRVLAASGNQAIMLSAQTDNDPTYAGAGTTAIYIQDAQVNLGLVAQDYLETTTTAVYGGVTDNLPRLDYSGGASCPSLLLEPQRTNYLPESEYIAAWGGANATIVTNAAISPEGVQNASSITFASGGYWYKSITRSYSAGQSFTWSIYANTQDQVTRWGGSTPSGTDTFSFEDAGNGWYRQTLTRVVSGSGTANFQPLMDSVFVGVGTTFNVYGAQFEEGSYPTSYIPTYGSGSQTRVQDLSVTSSPSTSLFGQTEGTIFIEFKVNAITSGDYSRIMNLKNAGGSNQIYFQQNDSRLTSVVFNGSNQFSASLSSGSLVVGQTYKAALAYKNADYALYVDGTQINTGNASGLGTLSVDRVDFTTGSGNIGLGNECKQALVFKTRLTNAELAALTA